MKTLLHLALRSLRRNRRRSAITLAAVGLGVAVVVFAYGFGEGLVALLVKDTLESRTGAIQIHKKGWLEAQETLPVDLDLPADEAFVARIRAVPGVAAASGRIAFGALLSNGETQTMVMAQGIDPVAELAVTPGRRDDVAPADGRFIDDESPHGAVIGKELAAALGSELGASLTLTTSTQDGGMNALDVDVIGLTPGAAFLESKRATLVPLRYAQELLAMEGRVTEYAVRVDDLSRVDEVAAELQRALGPEVEVHTWRDVMPFLRDSMNRLTLVLRGVSVVLFAIVVLGVINTMLMSVYERVREIGTLLAIGVRRRQVQQLFLLEAFTLGALGGIAGALLGFAVTWGLGETGIPIQSPGSAIVQVIEPVPSLPVALIAVVVAAAGALLAALYPARKASRMNPVDALRDG